MELASKQGAGDFQPRGQAWSPEREDVVSLLERSEHRYLAPIYYGSNHCFLVTLDGGIAGQSLAVYKPARGEYPLYDFPSGTLYRREVGSWLVSDMLGWNVVPPTVVCRGKYGLGSLQLFIESYPDERVEIRELQHLALLDIVLNNADRKSDHCLVGEDGKLWGIDHGLTFHAHPKLRTVLWHFAGDQIEADDFRDLSRLRQALSSGSEAAARQLRALVSAAEWESLIERLKRLVRGGRFPDPRYKSVPYRW